MSTAGDHQTHDVIIRRRGRSHRSSCSCGWTGRSWNELRPAEADAWEHLFGDSRIVEVGTIAGAEEHEVTPGQLVHAAARAPTPGNGTGTGETAAVSNIVLRARALAGRPSPYSRRARDELWHLASREDAAIAAAISEVEQLLARHSRRSASTADAQWLELITAKRLLEYAASNRDGDD